LQPRREEFYVPKRKVPFIGAIILLLSTGFLRGQTLSLSSATVSSAGTATLNLTLIGGGNSAAGLQWTFQYPAAAISAISAAAGPALTAAGKALQCQAASGSYSCIASGMNNSPIADGVAAVISVTASKAAAITVANQIGATPAGSTLSLSATGGSITVPLSAASVPTLSSLVCTPTSIAGAASSSCMVTLNAPATAATVVALSSNNNAIVLPQSAIVPTGSTIAQFAAVSSGSLNATAMLTASLNGVSQTFNLALSTSTFSLRMHAGAIPFVDAQGFTWSADSGYTGGSQWSTTNTLGNTSASALYQSVRWGNFGYQFTVPNGSYTVNLKFAEVSLNRIGQRIFSVGINGVAVLQNFDVVAAAGGPLVAIDEAFPVTVTNGSIQISFYKGAVDYPMVNAIEIVQQGTPLSSTITPAPATFTPVDANSGGAAFTDLTGKVWTADKSYMGGTAWSTTHGVTGTTTPQIYQSCRYGNFYYFTSLPNGKYTVTLKFAEISRTGAGQRVFNVQINGASVLNNFDIIVAAGAPFVALDKTFPVTVSNGMLVLGFQQGPSDLPLINAIQVVQAP
jgi:hypothetical protein